MYLQITEKCNMLCSHCCFSCDMTGKHGDIYQIINSINFMADYGDEYIAIGGGEPTLHPDFFEILKTCLCNFDGVWMATNGSQTETMFRIANILDDEDYPDSMDFEDYDELDYDFIHAEDKLTVALSLDCFHSTIDERIVSMWKQRKWEIRNVLQNGNNLSNQGRAKENDLTDKTDCCCPGLLIKPNGDIKLCGCDNSPIIGNTSYGGIDYKWEQFLQSDDSDSYHDYDCYKHM